MKISVEWLRTFIDPGLDDEKLFEFLSSSGLPVDAVEPVAGATEGVVVGEIREAARHPNAEKLSVCRVFDGTAEVDVVCGAPNARPGLKSAFARVGATLPQGQKIGKAKLRGVESHGMLCSAAELAMGDDASGIVELPADARPGQDIRQALALDDVAIELDLTPNRGDCLSVLGIARELGVLTGRPLTYAPAKAVASNIRDEFPVTLEPGAGCPKYLGRVIRGIDLTRPSPIWMTERLRRSGLRAIDPVVDVTNYVMLELGQPLHAFDLARLTGGIHVRRARAKEQLVLLDGRKLDLVESALMITDASGPVALAGVMGGERSGINAETRDVFLECAFFTPSVISPTARRYAAQTDASQRFERGVDPELQLTAIERATALLLDIVGGSAGPITVAITASDVPARKHVSLRHRRLNQLVGDQIAATEVELILGRLSVTRVQKEGSGGNERWTIEAPSHRFDLSREEDLVEEVCRVRGYASIPVRKPVTELELMVEPRDKTPRSRAKHLLADLGYQEIITYSFVDPRRQDLLDPGSNPVKITNPMSLEESVMRTNLLPGLLGALAANSARQQTRVKLFELGRCFVRGEQLSQRWMLGGVLWGDRMPESWTSRREPVDFFDAKGDLEKLFAMSRVRAVTFEPLDDPVLHPGQAATISSEGHPIGRVGRLHPELEQRLDLKTGVFVFEVDADRALVGEPPRYTPVSRQPSVRRDLSLTLNADIAASQVEQVVRSVTGEVLTEFRIFDVYDGEGVDSNEKRLAVGLTFQEPSRTLTDQDINGLVTAAVGALERELGARLR
jgi:phenylalanyl-tRNA synthetase beta chain